MPQSTITPVAQKTVYVVATSPACALERALAPQHAPWVFQNEENAQISAAYNRERARPDYKVFPVCLIAEILEN